MPSRPEPLLAERLWAHPSSFYDADGPVTADTDDAGRIRGVTYPDGGSETYTYDPDGRVV